MEKPKIELNLKMDLIPSSMWNKSIYRYLKSNNNYLEWRKIKKDIFSKEGHKCWICGKENEVLYAHEFWDYDEKKKLQRLKEIHHLCVLCHMIQHYGYATTNDGINLLKSKGYNIEDLEKHFCKINECSKQLFEDHKDKAFKIHSLRSKIKWDQHWGDYEYIKQTTPIKHLDNHITNTEINKE